MPHKVNFCKFTNETRNGIEDASELRPERRSASINGTAAGGGYELALAADHIMLVDDGSSTVSLPELPLLAVLPGTGGLTRVTDKRKVRRDHADVFCTTEEGIKGKRAVEWRLVDEVVPNSKLEDARPARAKEFAAKSAAPGRAKGIALTPLKRERSRKRCRLQHRRRSSFDRAERLADHHAARSRDAAAGIRRCDGGARCGFLAAAPRARTRRRDPRPSPQRARDRRDRVQVVGDPAQVLPTTRSSTPTADHWLAREIRHCWKRVLKRVDLTSRSLVALIEPGSCFAGTLAELVFASDRSYMLIGAARRRQQAAGDDRAR